MKVLLDACVWGRAVDELREAGHEVEWVGSWEQDPGDERVLAWARARDQILVTLDKDFGELAIVRGLPHSGIVRLVGFPARQQALACLEILARFGTDLLRGGIVTAEPGRARVRPPE